MNPGDSVRITDHPHRTGQYGRVSEHPAPRGFFNVHIPAVALSRDRAKAFGEIKAGRFVAVSLIAANQLEAA
ncbi:hypothetical protein [Crenobacter cavernae]|uniref:Cold-shock protein n=1 Tax=Crenobacter cavernae TaxID=2290923 RepID=A0ABY0FDG3_9NEIS|nr:hypothetical protein [Crenobacter cavernae]RXZ42658.1 hypothetical protein EBB06_12240 [Crenobacter cavernae]